MERTTVGVVIKQQAWFRPHVSVEGLEAFPADQIDVVALHPTNVFRVRVLLGCGPLNRELVPEFLLWFEHGEVEYPVFQSPSIGPSNAGLKLSSNPRHLTAANSEALALIEASAVIPVSASFRSEFEGATAEQNLGGPVSAVRAWLSEAMMWLEQAIGLYALYQYPIVWEPIGVHPVIGLVDIEAQTFKTSTRFEPDNLIPFRLNVSSRVKKGQLVDGGLADFARLRGQDLHFPLLLLQRALWQRNVHLRFLDTFLLLDYLTGQSPFEDPGRAEREQLYTLIEKCVLDTNPEHAARIRALKHIVLQSPLRERLHRYLSSMGISLDEAVIGQMLKVRNDLAHARPVEDSILIPLELQARSLAREALRRELASRGFTFGGVPPAA